MLKFGNKEFRNLQEQVEKNMKDILFILQEEGVLNEFGIKVIGQEDTAASMPTVSDYKENNPDWAYGDAYAIGTKAPYTLYILTRANGTHPNDYWFNIGSFPMTGPQGPKGDTGDTGPQGPTGNPGTNGLDAGFGEISATAETVSPTDPATVTIATSGPNTAKNISFAFEIPQGEKGKDGASEWGDIGGSLENQADLINALQAKQNASNAVTTDGTQTITGDKTFNNIKLSGNIYLGGANTSQIQFGDQYTYIKTNNDNDLMIKSKGGTIWCERNVKPNGDNLNLGSSGARWKDLYLSGILSDGTNSISVADIAPKSEYATKKDLDDLKSIVYGIHSLTYNSYEFPYLTSSIIPDEVDGRKVVGGSYAMVDWVGGNSISFNQLVPLLTSSTISGVVFTTSSEGRKMTLSGTSNTYWTYAKEFNVDVPIGHKVLVSIKVKNPNDVFMGYRLRNESTDIEYEGKDYQQVRTMTKMINRIQFYGNPNIDYGGVEIEDVQLFDLTRMGLDNITTVDEFKALFPLDYYQYNAGEIKSTILSKIESYSTKGVKLGEIDIPNAPLRLDGVNDIHNTLTFEEQEDGTYNAILTKKFILYDLGALNWSYDGDNTRFYSEVMPDIAICQYGSSNPAPNMICPKYETKNTYYLDVSGSNMLISTNNSSSAKRIFVKDTSYTNPTDFKSAMSGVYLLCERATPTTETIATGLTFDDTTFKIEKGGTIKAIYEEVPPTISVNFMTKGE